MAELKLPTEIVMLPSKGLVYPESNPLSSGSISMKYMTAREEDILTNTNFIKNGTVIDKLLQSLIVSKINYDDLVMGDKNAILVAARILGYGKDYSFTYKDEEVTIDLQTLQTKELDESLFTKGTNEFKFELPNSGNQITFKLLTHGDEKKIEDELKGLAKAFPKGSFDLTTRLKYMITSVEGKRDQKSIRDFIDNYLIAKDSRAFREYYKKIQPDIILKFMPEDENYTGEGVNIPIDVNFFWPDAGI